MFVLLALTTVLVSGCNVQKEPQETTEADKPKETVNMTDQNETDDSINNDRMEEAIVPYETNLLGAHGGYFFIPIDGKTYRYTVGDQWDAVYEKDSLVYQFDVDEFGEHYSYKIFSYSSFPDYTYLACEYTGPYGLEDEIVLCYSPALKTADEDLQRAKKDDFVIMENGSAVQGQDIWKDFYDKTSKGRPAMVMIGQYYTLENRNLSEDLYEATKDDYPFLALSQLEYDGKKYIISPLHYQDGDYIVKEVKGVDNPVTEWKYLLHFTGDATSPDALYSEYDRYVLCNENVTWGKIMQGSFSSQMGDYIPYQEVYNEYTWKE